MNQLEAELDALDIPCDVIGNAVKARKVINAVSEAYHAYEGCNTTPGILRHRLDADR